MSAPILAYRTKLGGRGYKHPVTGAKVPSITTVVGTMAKPVLVPAAAKFCAEYADRNWDRLAGLPNEARVNEIKGSYRAEWNSRADLGTRVHEVAEAWAMERPLPPIDDDMAGFVGSVLGFLEDRSPEFLAIEATVWSETHGYAGTLDFVALMDDLITFGDYKTGKAVYPEVGMQVAAAINADYIIAPDGSQFPVPEAQAAVAVHIRPQGYKVHELNLDGCFEAFLGLRQAYRFHEIEGRVLS